VEILWLLIPMSAVLVLAILAIFGWALHRGQFEDLEHEGERILLDEQPSVATPGVDADQGRARPVPEESRPFGAHSRTTT
jgi:cbb3-type cytochrome oxidase maturation protein